MVGDELAHRFGQVHAQVVPYEHDRAAELDVRPDARDRVHLVILAYETGLVSAGGGEGS